MMTPADRSERIAAHRAEVLALERIVSTMLARIAELKQILKVVYEEGE